MKNRDELERKLLKLCEALMEDHKEDSEKVSKLIEKRKVIKEMEKDLKEFFTWSLNLDEGEGLDCEETKEKWKELHPNLPIPRICHTGNSYDTKVSAKLLLFFMDAYPLFLEHRKKG